MKSRTVLLIIGAMLLMLVTSSFASSTSQDTLMVWVDRGGFFMGSEEGESYEKPVHTVFLTYDYLIGKYEVTNEEFCTFINARTAGILARYNGRELIESDGLYCELEYRNNRYEVKRGKGLQNPIMQVTWWGAIEYCNWMSEIEGLSKAYDRSGNLLDKNGMVTTDITQVEGYRLPTEAEWEYAARGGQKSRGTRYAGSDDLDEVGWYWQNSGDKWLHGTDKDYRLDQVLKNKNSTHPVGQKQPNELGLYDMSGNVFEWCYDWYGDYTSATQTNPLGAIGGSYRVLRGGGWGFFAQGCLVAYRDYDLPESSGSIGFRLVRTDIESSAKKVEQRVKVLDAYVAEWDSDTEKKAPFSGDESGVKFVVQFSNWYEPHWVYGKTYNQNGILVNNSEKSPFLYEGERDGETLVSFGYDFSTNEEVKEFMKKNSGRWKEEIFVDHRLEITLFFTIDRKSKIQGTTLIESVPNAAAVYVDGNYKGITPYALTGTSGSREVAVIKKGYISQNKSVRIRAGENTLERFTLTAEFEARPTEFNAPVMVKLSQATFQMREAVSNTEGSREEKPAKFVALTYDYWIGKYEITFAEFNAFFHDIGKTPLSAGGWDTRSVANITWWDAVAYCNWLSRREGIPVAYLESGEQGEGSLLDGNGRITTDILQVKGYRLPTEAEWEYAARGGANSKGYKYAGSSVLNDVGWYWQNSGEKWLAGTDRDWEWVKIQDNKNKTHPVGQKKPNELGLYDMSGNVFEWCHDWHGDYAFSTLTNPIGPSSGSYRVIRGGSWSSNEQSCQVAYRSLGAPSGSLGYLGFRVVRTAF